MSAAPSTYPARDFTPTAADVAELARDRAPRPPRDPARDLHAAELLGLCWTERRLAAQLRALERMLGQLAALHDLYTDAARRLVKKHAAVCAAIESRTK